MASIHLDVGDVILEGGVAYEITDVAVGTFFDEHGLRAGSYSAVPIAWLDVDLRFQDGRRVLDTDDPDFAGLWQR